MTSKNPHTKKTYHLALKLVLRSHRRTYVTHLSKTQREQSSQRIDLLTHEAIIYRHKNKLCMYACCSLHSLYISGLKVDMDISKYCPRNTHANWNSEWYQNNKRTGKTTRLKGIPGQTFALTEAQFTHKDRKRETSKLPLFVCHANI